MEHDEDENVRMALDELLELAHDESGPGPQALLRQCQDETGRAAAEGFLEGLMKAFGHCAFSLVANDEEEAQLLAQARSRFEGLAWAQRAYQDAVFLQELNPNLTQDPAELSLRQARLKRWLGESA